MPAAKKYQAIPLGEVIERQYGKKGTAKRDAFENKVAMLRLGIAAREAREHLDLTREQLGKLAGVSKYQISRLENSFESARFDAVINVFKAIGAKLDLLVELQKPKNKMRLVVNGKRPGKAV